MVLRIAVVAAMLALSNSPAANAVTSAPSPCATAIACVRAPEIDPSSMVSAITLLVGGLAVLRGRSNKNK